MSLPVPVLALPSPGGPMTLRVGRRPRWAPSRGSRARTLLCPQGPCPRRGAGGCAGPGPAAPGPVRLVWVGRPRTRRWQYARPRRGSRARGHGPVSVVRQDGLHGPGVAPSVASLARVLAGQGRGSAPSPARRPPGRPGAAVRLPRSERLLAAGSTENRPGQRPQARGPPAFFGDHWRLAVAWLVARAATSHAAVRVLRQGACAPTACPRRPPGRQRGLVEPHPQGPAGPGGGSRQSAGRGAHHRQALQAHHPRRRNERFHPALLRRHGQAAPAPPPSPGPRAQARRPRPHPHDTERPHQSLPGRTTPAQARDATEAAQAPRPPHDDPPAQPARPPKAPRPRGTQIRPHRHQAHHHRTQRHHQPRRDRLPRLQLPSGPGGPDHLGRPQDHHHRPPRQGPLPQYPWPQPGTRHASHHGPATRATPGDRPRKNPRNVTDALTHQPSPIS